MKTYTKKSPRDLTIKGGCGRIRVEFPLVSLFFQAREVKTRGRRFESNDFQNLIETSINVAPSGA